MGGLRGEPATSKGSRESRESRKRSKWGSMIRSCPSLMSSLAHLIRSRGEGKKPDGQTQE
jgi:hypothetical protein